MTCIEMGMSANGRHSASPVSLRYRMLIRSRRSSIERPYLPQASRERRDAECVRHYAHGRGHAGRSRRMTGQNIPSSRCDVANSMRISRRCDRLILSVQGHASQNLRANPDNGSIASACAQPPVANANFIPWQKSALSAPGVTARSWQIIVCASLSREGG